MAGLITATSITMSLAAIAQTRVPRTFCVSPSGDDSDGRSRETAFKNLYDVLAKALPGDTVLVTNGTYTRSEFRDAAIYIGVLATKDAYITFKAFPGHRPKLKSAGNVNGMVLDLKTPAKTVKAMWALHRHWHLRATLAL